MELILDILIPTAYFPKLKLFEKFIEWGGEKFSQDPPEYEFSSSVLFRKNICTKYYQNILGYTLSIDDYTVLTLKGDSLSELEIAVNNESVNRDKSELISFICELYSSIDTFVIILLLNEEQIDEKHQIPNVDDAISTLLSSLNWSNPRGLVIAK